jgi:hypothetical protein
MALRWALFAVLAALLTLVPGCKPKTKVQPVSVKVFLDPSSPYAPALDHRILDFEATNPRLSNGALVLVGNLGLTNPQSAINNMEDPAVEIVILNSPAEAVNYPAVVAEMPHAVNVCGAMEACPAEVPALVPSKLQGDRAEAANKFVQFLASKTMAAPLPVQPSSQPAPSEAAPAQAEPAKPATRH